MRTETFANQVVRFSSTDIIFSPKILLLQVRPYDVQGAIIGPLYPHQRVPKFVWTVQLRRRNIAAWKASDPGDDQGRSAFAAESGGGGSYTRHFVGAL